MTEIARTITVTGSGTAEAVPDLLTVSIGVECRREDVGAAYAAAGRASAGISAALREHGVGDPDISTSGLNVRADVVWKEGQGQTVAGYVASSVTGRPAAGCCRFLGSHRRTQWPPAATTSG